MSGIGCGFCLWLFLDFSVYLFSLNNHDSGFKGVFIQEDLTNQRAKMLKYLKGTITLKGRVMLKADRGAGRRVVIKTPDDMFKIGVDNVDIIQFGFIDV